MTEATVESKAAALGWVPKEQFRGDTAKWVDAETFVERGEQMMPLLRANNKRLEDELNGMKGKLTQVEQLFQASQEAISELKKFHSEDTARQVTEAKKKLRLELAEARKEGDTELEVQIETQLDDLRDAEAAARTKAATPSPTPAPAPAQVKAAEDPEYTAWAARTPWLGTNRRMSALAITVAEELRADPANRGLVGRAFFDKITEEVEAVFNTRPAGSKVEASAGSSGGGGGAKKRSFADLPKEAKDACAAQAGKLVGTGRGFKTMAEWQTYYAEQYYANEE
jgi:hypothetical protein